MRVNFQMTDLCRATTGLAIIVLDSHHNFIDVLICVGPHSLLNRADGFNAKDQVDDHE